MQLLAGRDRLGVRRQHVRRGAPAFVVHPPQSLGARVEDLDRRVGALDRRPPRAVVADDGDQLEDAIQARVPVARRQPRPDAEHEPADHGVGIAAEAPRLVGDLRHDLPDRQLVELAGQHDAGVREAGTVQLTGGVNGEVRQIA